MSKKGEVVRFPLGSSTDCDRETMNTLETVVREGIEDIIVVGLDSEGALTVIHDPNMPTERAHFLLSKALQRVSDEPLDLEICDDDEEEEEEDESLFENE